MTEIKPATDEEIEAWRDASTWGTVSLTAIDRVARMKARVDAEKAARERAEEEAETIATLSRIERKSSAASRDALAAKVAWRDRQVAALREALTFYRDGFAFHPKRSATGINLSTWEPRQALFDDCGERALAALAPEAAEPAGEDQP